MGQFHSDFTSDKLVKDIKSIESYFLGKKCYIDKLQGINKDGNIDYDYHIRMKGVSNDAILNNGDVFETYKKLYHGEEIIFDLTCNGNKKIFRHTKDYDIETIEQFKRAISFKNI